MLSRKSLFLQPFAAMWIAKLTNSGFAAVQERRVTSFAKPARRMGLGIKLRGGRGITAPTTCRCSGGEGPGLSHIAMSPTRKGNVSTLGRLGPTALRRHRGGNLHRSPGLPRPHLGIRERSRAGYRIRRNRSLLRIGADRGLASNRNESRELAKKGRWGLRSTLGLPVTVAGAATGGNQERTWDIHA